MSCDACKRAGNDGRTCRFCGETAPHQSAVIIADEIAALRATLASRDKELSLLERDYVEARRDLATRGRELAEVRDRLDEKRQLVKDATDTVARRNAEHDELAAKLAEKERQLGHRSLAVAALAARQQQPDGKPETLRDHVARHKEGDEGP